MTEEKPVQNEIERVLAKYRPRRSHSPEVADVFPDVRDECIRAVRATGPTVAATARSRMSFIVRFATFLVTSGMWRPQDGQVMPVTATLVSSFAEKAAAEGHGSPNALRTQLSAIGRAYVPGFWFDNPYATAGYGPYMPVEVSALWHAASRLRHDVDDPTVAAVVAAGFGAGLTGDDFRVVRGHHVVRDPDGHVFVEVRGTEFRDRTVPMERLWGDRLVAVAEVLGDGLLVGGTVPSASVLGAVKQRARRSGLAMLSIRRMRATWTLRRLQDGVPLDVLMHYAGLKSAHAFDRLLPYVTARSAEMELAMVRGDLRR